MPGGSLLFNSSFTLFSPSDFAFGGGASFTHDPLVAIRSGNPRQYSVAAFAPPLRAGVTLKRIAFGYRYNSGFGAAGVGVGANFTLRAAGSATIWTANG